MTSRGTLSRNLSVLLAGACLLPGSAIAQQVWTGPGNNFNSAANWTPATVPGPGQTAVFDTAAPSRSNVTANTTINGIQFGINSNAYNFDVHLTTGDLTLTGAGVIDNIATPRGGNFRQTISIDPGRTLTFQNNATVNTGGVDDAVFLSGSLGSIIRFEGTSSAGDAGLNADGTIVNARTSGSLTVGRLNGSGAIRFDGGSTNLSVNAGLSGSSLFGGSIIDGTTTGALTVNSGTLILSGTSTYTGGSTINAGAGLQFEDGSSILGNVTNNGTLLFNRTNASAFGGDISGAGGVAIFGGNNAVVTFTGTNTYAGTTTISAANTLELGNGGTSGSIAGNVSLGNSASILAFNRSDTYTYNGIISGSGGLQHNGTGTTVLGSASTYTGGTTVSDGILRLGLAGNLGSGTALMVNSPGVFDLNGRTQTVGDLIGSGGISLNAGGILTAGGAASTTFSGSLSGTGGLTKAGAIA